MFCSFFFLLSQNHRDVLQLKPFHLVKIPFQLDSHDSGGSLEISLLIDPLNGDKTGEEGDRVRFFMPFNPLRAFTYPIPYLTQSKPLRLLSPPPHVHFYFLKWLNCGILTVY